MAEISDPRFEEPRLAINRVYTRRGDDGDTSLVSGHRVSKDDLRIVAYGTVDELNAFVGVARVTCAEDSVRWPSLRVLAHTLRRVQHELFNAGSILATLPEDVHPRQARITIADTERLEAEMDRMLAPLPALRSFVLPGGSRLNAELHVCRTVCRRAERACVRLRRHSPVDSDTLKYLNRLSDAFFVWSRWVIFQTQASETLWEPNIPASDDQEAENG